MGRQSRKGRNVGLIFIIYFFLSTNSSCRKDVRLPVQLQRAMAAEAEAAREARAKVSYLIIFLDELKNKYRSMDIDKSGFMLV